MGQHQEIQRKCCVGARGLTSIIPNAAREAGKRGHVPTAVEPRVQIKRNTARWVSAGKMAALLTSPELQRRGLDYREEGYVNFSLRGFFFPHKPLSLCCRNI